MIRESTILDMERYRLLKERKIANLRRYLKIYDLKQKEVADILSSQESNVSDMLRGKRTISDETIYRLCDHAGISPIFFFEDAEEPLALSDTERRIIKRLRERPAIAHPIDVMSKTLFEGESSNSGRVGAHGEAEGSEDHTNMRRKKTQRRAGAA